MQLSIDVMDLICDDSVARLLMSLTCRDYNVQIDYSDEMVAKYCDVTTIEKLNIGRLFYRAINFDRVDLLQLYHRRRPQLIQTFLKKNITATQEAVDDQYPWVTEVCSIIAHCGSLTLLKWSRENGCEWDDTTCTNAAEAGNLEILKYCKESGCEWDECTFYYAALGGHLDVLQWMLDNGCPWSDETTVAAAMEGNIQVLKWLRANGCPWHPDTCREASIEGQLEVLQWAVAKGYDWDPEECRRGALDYRRHHVVEWINEWINTHR
jgi:hypothetical protein